MTTETPTMPPLPEQVHAAERALDVVHEVARAVLVPRDSIGLCRIVFRALRSVMTVDAGFIDRFDHDAGKMQQVYRFDEDIEESTWEHWDYRGSATISWIVAHRQPLVFADFQTDMPARFPEARRRVFGDETKLSRAWMTAPLLIGDRLVGVINAQSYQEGLYGAAELSLVELIGSPVGVALEHARLLSAMERAVDELEIPVIPLTANILVMPLVDMLDAARWERATEAALEAVLSRGAAGLLLDASGLTAFDMRTIHALTRLMNTLRLMGAESVLIGMRPALIEEMVRAPVDLGALRTERDLPAGLRLLRRLLG